MPDARTSITRLTMLFQPRSGTSLRLMMGMPSRSSRAALMVAYCTRSGTTLMSRHSLLTLLMSCSSLRVLLERQRDVELVDAVRRRPRSMACVERAQHGQAARSARGGASSTKPTTR